MLARLSSLSVLDTSVMAKPAPLSARTLAMMSTDTYPWVMLLNNKNL